jgi:hypothetical protein
MIKGVLPRLRSSMEPRRASHTAARNDFQLADFGEPKSAETYWRISASRNPRKTHKPTATAGTPAAAQTNSYPSVLWSITTPGPMVEEMVTRFRY